MHFHLLLYTIDTSDRLNTLNTLSLPMFPCWVYSFPLFFTHRPAASLFAHLHALPCCISQRRCPLPEASPLGPPQQQRPRPPAPLPFRLAPQLRSQPPHRRLLLGPLPRAPVGPPPAHQLQPTSRLPLHPARFILVVLCQQRSRRLVRQQPRQCSLGSHLVHNQPMAALRLGGWAVESCHSAALLPNQTACR